MVEKKPLTGLFRDQPATPEGKYLVLRRDGTVPPWPSFVLGGADPVAAVALRAYAAEVVRLLDEEPEKAFRLGFTYQYAQSLERWAQRYEAYCQAHGEGDPGKGPHRKDEPWVIELMKQGFSG